MGVSSTQPPTTTPLSGGSVPPTLGDTQHQRTARASISPRRCCPFWGDRGMSLPLAPPAEPLPGRGVPLPVDQAGLPHREVAHHDDLGDLEPAGQGDTRPLSRVGGSPPAPPALSQPHGQGGFVGCVGGVTPQLPVSSSALQPSSPTPPPAAAQTPAFPPRCIPAP